MTMSKGVFDDSHLFVTKSKLVLLGSISGSKRIRCLNAMNAHFGFEERPVGL
jgi:hypothetical protein